MSTAPGTAPAEDTGVLSGRTVLVAGAGSPSGTAVCEALNTAGAKVVAIGRDAARLENTLFRLNNADLRTCNLDDPEEVAALAADMQEIYGGIDGLIHLVGGWRAGTGIGSQTEQDWDFLETNILRTLRNVSRSFYDQLAASPVGRLAIVSSTSVDTPTAAGAGYAAAKAAAEAWVRAIAQGFTGGQSGRKENPEPQHSAAVVFVVKALVDEQQRKASPERKFPGYTDVRDLAAAAVRLFQQDAAEINGQRISLVPPR
ncbi:SDR family NAD(P)-dependent oxidoreductase [Arthrobacter yangruifuii]|uniref:SDR family NAD(P)-dependent oxidoreductase n=1 Tax=Arthrobacter yangruifuii TaxID=2606616 RepID=A0A5N6MHT0_9MICC|nr:SDR family NAD(P)-dependent oxidoreductase [Arthrobacter yangruifuii]KAD3633147.1 SDR family NAD(P)-dependent oxidoreductase [Arthrobacter yangruifuii]